MDVLLLSRIQFAVTIAFHYIYPPLSIGLVLILVIMEALYLKTGDPLYRGMTKFWVKVFGLTFAVGVATGAAFLGAFAGNRLLKKVTMHTIQIVVAVLLIVVAVGLGAGLI